ncbi:MAG: iron-containing redox enzyme family protein [Deltaproteobacteria bacterium]|nr:iron-containing redox enzyme family protein [Deltaproteobacteria bacterium]
MRTWLAALRARLDASSTPYFRALADGSLSRAAFVESQVQFFRAVAHFNRPMLVLASRLERLEDRLPLVQNAFDEHGRGELAGSHERTFLELLARLGVAEREARARPIGPAVRAFNATLDGVCGAGEAFGAVATLGIIEDLFAVLSAELGRGIVARGWLRRDEVVHYATHEVLDLEHSEMFHRIVEPLWATRRDEIAAGFELGAHAFLQLFDALHAAAAAR